MEVYCFDYSKPYAHTADILRTYLEQAYRFHTYVTHVKILDPQKGDELYQVMRTWVATLTRADFDAAVLTLPCTYKAGFGETLYRGADLYAKMHGDEVLLTFPRRPAKYKPAPEHGKTNAFFMACQNGRPVGFVTASVSGTAVYMLGIHATLPVLMLKHLQQPVPRVTESLIPAVQNWGLSHGATFIFVDPLQTMHNVLVKHHGFQRGAPPPSYKRYDWAPWLLEIQNWGWNNDRFHRLLEHRAMRLRSSAEYGNMYFDVRMRDAFPAIRPILCIIISYCKRIGLSDTLSQEVLLHICSFMTRDVLYATQNII